MSAFYTIVGFDAEFEMPITDTDVSTNSHRSVRSYKTPNAATQAIARGVKMPGVAFYRILGTYLLADGKVEYRWMDGKP